MYSENNFHTNAWIWQNCILPTYYIEFKISGWIWNWISFIFSVIIFRMGYFPFYMAWTPFGQKWLHWWKWRRLVDTGIQNDTCDSWTFHNMVNSEWKKTGKKQAFFRERFFKSFKIHNTLMTYLLIVSYSILAHWFKCPFFQVYHDLICILCIGVIFFRLFSQWCYSLKMVATICIVSNTILCFQIQLLMWVIYRCGMAMKLGGLHLPLLLQKGIYWP